MTRGLMVAGEAVADAKPIERAGAEVLDDDVGLAEQVREHRARVGMFQVQGDAVLPAEAVEG